MCPSDSKKKIINYDKWPSRLAGVTVCECVIVWLPIVFSVCENIVNMGDSQT